MFSPSIAELARQLSEAATQFYRGLGDDLDRRMGAVLGPRPDQDVSRWFRQPLLSMRVDDEDRSPALASSPESNGEPDSFLGSSAYPDGSNSMPLSVVPQSTIGEKIDSIGLPDLE